MGEKAFNDPKCSSKWFNLQMFLGIQDSRIPVFSMSANLVPGVLGCGDFVFFSQIFMAIADFLWVTQTKTMVFLKSAVAKF